MSARRFFPLLLVFAFVLALPALEAAPASPERQVFLLAPEEAVQGDPLTVFLRAALEIQGANLELRDEGGRAVLSFPGFRLPSGPPAAEAAVTAGVSAAAEAAAGGAEGVESAAGSPPGTDGWAAVAGIPSTLPPGLYTLAARVRHAGGSETAEAPIRIAPRNFVFEDIPLNLAMSELRSEPDPRKDEEARELYRLLGRFDPSAVFHPGPFLPPVGDFRETSFFGDRRTYLYSDGGKAKAIHQGIDFATPRGTPVIAAGAGRVVMAKSRIMSGHTVVIEHLPGVYSLYYHLDGITVEEGRTVTAGERIGISGATGLITGPHLHWEVRASGVAVEPKKMLQGGLLDKDGFFSMIREDFEKGR